AAASDSAASDGPVLPESHGSQQELALHSTDLVPSPPQLSLPLEQARPHVRTAQSMLPLAPAVARYVHAAAMPSDNADLARNTAPGSSRHRGQHKKSSQLAMDDASNL